MRLRTTTLATPRTRTDACLQAADESGQPGQRLLAAAPHADKQSVATGRFQDAVDATDVHHGVLEQHQVHSGVHLVVAVQGVHEKLAQFIPVGYRHVLTVSQTIRKVTVDVGLLKNESFVGFLEQSKWSLFKLFFLIQITGKCLYLMTLTAFPRNISTQNQFESSSNWIGLRQPQRRALQTTHIPSKANADFKTLLIYKPFLKSIHKTSPYANKTHKYQIFEELIPSKSSLLKELIRLGHAGLVDHCNLSIPD